MSDAPAAEYAVTIVEALSANPGLMGISDISRETGINKNAVSRVLGALTEKGWVYQEGVRYQLTLKPFRTTSRALAKISVYSAAQTQLTKLWEQTGESCYLGVLKNDSVLYLAHLDSIRDLKIAGRVGGTYPLACSAPGKVLLAYSDTEYRHTYLQDYFRADPIRIAEKETELEKIRKRGYATDIEEYGPGILCFAAPVFDGDGRIAAAIGISTSTVYTHDAQMITTHGQYVLDAAHAISVKMGNIP